MATSAIAATASGLAAQALSARHEVAVLNKARDVQEVQGQAILQLIESAGQTGHAAQPQVSGSIIDVRV